MVVVEVKAPKKYNAFLEDSSEFQWIIAEVVYDYVEKKQDNITKKKLENSSYFQGLNNSLESKLWSL
jgi:hypothetical protein